MENSTVKGNSLSKTELTQQKENTPRVFQNSLPISMFLISHLQQRKRRTLRQKKDKKPATPEEEESGNPIKIVIDVLNEDESKKVVSFSMKIIH